MSPVITVSIMLPSTHRTVSATLTSQRLRGSITSANAYGLHPLCLRLTHLSPPELKTRYRIRLIVGFLVGLSPTRECAPRGALCVSVVNKIFTWTNSYPSLSLRC